MQYIISSYHLHCAFSQPSTYLTNQHVLAVSKRVLLRLALIRRPSIHYTGRTGVCACVDFAAGTRLVLTNHNSVVTLKLSGTFSHFMTFLYPRMGYKGWVTNFEAMGTKNISTLILLIVLTNHVCCMIPNRFHNAIYGHDYEFTR